MKNLLLTLGHNSSAILIEDNEIKWGYETERLTGVKSDSQFPSPVIDKYMKGQPDLVYVSHWAPNGLLTSMRPKHWRPENLDGCHVRTLTVDRTHHDAHMVGAMAYAGNEFCERSGTYGLVIDGFGTLGEHFSVYRIHDGRKYTLQKRVHGYSTSLGLWYQYATAFMGLKMNEDEYKLLGYEAHIEYDDAGKISLMADSFSNHWIEEMQKSVYGSEYDPLYSVDALVAVKEKIFDHLLWVCKEFNIQDSTTHQARVILSHYVQAVLELVVLHHVKELQLKGMRNLIVSGGVFYNVKLNKVLVDRTQGHLCVYPLAGDQGAAIGLYAMDHPEFAFPSTLCWGHRKLKDMGEVAGLVVMNPAGAYDFVDAKLRTTGYVNLVRGSMEFGPRALCNTSTLALPTSKNVAKINYANGRNTVMPMAPVVLPTHLQERFSGYEHVWKSLAHMVVALEYRSKSEYLDMDGAAHVYNEPYPHATGRPQVLPYSDGLSDVLLKHGPLINTSFNYHGMPIALGMESVIANHMMQYRRDKSFTTVVIKNDK